MTQAIGIDLGTTNTVAAFRWGDVEVVTHPENEAPDRVLTRSMVAWHEGALVAGSRALNQWKADPAQVAVSVKRLMGRGIEDPGLQSVFPRFGYRITQPTDGTGHAVSVWLGNREFSPVDLSARILQQVLTHAHDFLRQSGKNDTVSEAVITIPAYFDDKQRDATRKAGERAGLRVLHLLPEPTAAAISYGLIPGVDVNSVLVYDFGGGTFDASLLAVADRTFIEVSKAGNLWLGGDDLDHALRDLVLERVRVAEGLDDIEKLVKAMPGYEQIRFESDLRVAVERAKIELSKVAETRVISATPFRDEAGMFVTVDALITREDFEHLIRPRIEESMRIARQALADANYTIEMVDRVLLVGGSSQIPLVQTLARALFGEDRVVIHPRPMTAVAEGAAIMAAGEVEKVGTVSRDYCIRLVNDPGFVVIRRNEVLPHRVMFPFKTVQDGQRLACFDFYSPDWVSGKQDSIGKMWLSLGEDLPRGTVLQTWLELEDGQEVLKVTAHVENHPDRKVSKTFSRGGADEKVYEELQGLLEASNALGLTRHGVEAASELSMPIVQAARDMLDSTGSVRPDQREKAEKALAELRRFSSREVSTAEFWINHHEAALGLCGELIPLAQRRRVQQLVDELRDAVSHHDVSRLQKLGEDARREHESYPEILRPVFQIRAAMARAALAGSDDAAVLQNALARLLGALRAGDAAICQAAYTEAWPTVQRWLAHESEDHAVVTGIRR